MENAKLGTSVDVSVLCKFLLKNAKNLKREFKKSFICWTEKFGLFKLKTSQMSAHFRYFCQNLGLKGLLGGFLPKGPNRLFDQKGPF